MSDSCVAHIAVAAHCLVALHIAHKLSVSFAKEPYKRDDILQNVVCLIHMWRMLPLLHIVLYGVATISRLLKIIGFGISWFYRALLQKRPTILRSLLIVATPYV